MEFLSHSSGGGKEREKRRGDFLTSQRENLSPISYGQVSSLSKPRNHSSPSPDIVWHGGGKKSRFLFPSQIPSCVPPKRGEQTKNIEKRNGENLTKFLLRTGNPFMGRENLLLLRYTIRKGASKKKQLTHPAMKNNTLLRDIPQFPFCAN